MEAATAQKLWSIGQSYFRNIGDSKIDGTIDNVRKIVQQYFKDVIAFSGDGYDGRNCSLMGTNDGVQYDWSFVGSMLFAITVYTTVGLCPSYLFILWPRLLFIMSIIWCPFRHSSFDILPLLKCRENAQWSESF